MARNPRQSGPDLSGISPPGPTGAAPKSEKQSRTSTGTSPTSLNRLSLLVVEDERPLARLWASELDHLVDATLAHSLEEARSKLRGRAFDAILLDLHLPDGNGMDLLREVATRGQGEPSRGDDPAVIILTGNADLNSAIAALRYGAYDYLIKPCHITELEQHLERIAQQQKLRDENLALRQQIMAQRATFELVGSSDALAQVRRLIARVAPTNASVLITGETGTGKEVAARMIHAQSARSAAPFVPVNCAALPRELAESELFGHRKGAFTGADRDHRGLVLAASGGTLLLDEIGDLPLEMQAKFLRLLESGEARRVGDTEAYRTDVRVIASTNRELRRDVADGRFRQDLFYRLATFDIRLPSLREIPEDIPAIARHLLLQASAPGAVDLQLSDAALAALTTYSWPGNVRELRNVVERARILCDQPLVLPEHLNIPAADARQAPLSSAAQPSTIAEMEWKMIEDALKKHGGNKTAAAKALGISLRTLYNKIDAHNTPASGAGPATATEHRP